MKKMGVPGKILWILILLLHKSSQQQVFNDEETVEIPEIYKIEWMKALNNDTLISDITIPGTHDSLALTGGPAAKCQAWSLEEQLMNGIRYFDFRVSGFRLKITHGPIFQSSSFPDALETITEFLSDYKSETVLVRIKPEFYFKSKVPDLVEDIIDKNISWVNETIPKISEVRGKIVFVQKNAFKLGIPLFETDQRNDYKVTDIELKKEKIRQHLTEARDDKSRNGTVVLNYSSGTGWPKFRLFKTPKKVASNINPWLYDHLNKEMKTDPKPCFGVIAMDFPGLDLIRKIIEFNY
ncbi:1-phosphatidylinositol phosphodiesterase-like [Pseudorasbora parva]|uniref:1-phosphatidylinositol phosphodiesterase-like n=1 Tax=Pseudorasbora parva TaxID=51549 RepID=UPI00351E66D2